MAIKLHLNITITYYYHTQLLGIKILYKTKKPNVFK